jgi:outer membrane protein OmpA-like peptidoglycan-associated protein
LASLGYAFDFGARVELEGSYRLNKLTSIDGSNASGRVRQLGVMVNGIYDIHASLFGFVPYVGAGVGGVRVSFDKTGPNFDPLDFIEDSAWTWGVQGLAGLDYRLAPNVRFGIRYNFLHVGKTDDLFTRLGNCACGNGPGGLTDNTSSFDPNNHSILVTAMLTFAAPPPPPPAPAPIAAPPPPLQRNFLVFFDFDRSDITSEADRVIVQAANNAKTAAVTRITLTGHADRSGPVPYNQRLSERRAEAVKARLVREGIPAGSIVTIGRGETQPLVPTADGVREPQNRRVEIVL